MASLEMLRSTAAFKDIQNDSRSRAHSLLLLRYRRNEIDRTRFGISTGRRVGSAVVRNRLRRRLRTILRHHASKLATGWDILFVVRPAGADATQAELELAFMSLTRRADLWPEVS